jgi:hypothetical protein
VAVIFVEAPNFQLYSHWLEQQADKGRYRYLHRPDMIADYHGEVIVLNGGSREPWLRSKIRLLEVAGQLTVSRRTV